MVFAIGPRILPHFGGVYRIFSTHLMLASLLLLQVGCTLRVCSEPLAYEGILPFAWKVLPISGMLELSGILIFAANILLTFAFGAFCIRSKNLRRGLSSPTTSSDLNHIVYIVSRCILILGSGRRDFAPLVT
jgi:hypothetical protein